jgi:hypothetical protein
MSQDLYTPGSHTRNGINTGTAGDFWAVSRTSHWGVPQHSTSQPQGVRQGGSVTHRLGNLSCQIAGLPPIERRLTARHIHFAAYAFGFQIIEVFFNGTVCLLLFDTEFSHGLVIESLKLLVTILSGSA